MKINISKKALEQLNDNYTDEAKTFRIMINGFGWGGPTFAIAQDEQYDDDYLEENNGTRLIVKKDLLEQFGGFSIEYYSNFFKKGFAVQASHGTSSC